MKRIATLLAGTALAGSMLVAAPAANAATVDPVDELTAALDKCHENAIGSFLREGALDQRVAALESKVADQQATIRKLRDRLRNSR